LFLRTFRACGTLRFCSGDARVAVCRARTRPRRRRRHYRLLSGKTRLLLALDALQLRLPLRRSKILALLARVLLRPGGTVAARELLVVIVRHCRALLLLREGV